MLRVLAIWGLLLIGALAPPVAGQQGENVYVVDFTTRDALKNTLTANFTYAFEQALVQSGCYSVLESRDFARLLTEVDRERAIADISQLSDSALANLRTEEAEMVVFGEVFDDVESGQVDVTVTFQKFDRTKALIRSTLLSRGKVYDAQSRQTAMDELAGKLCRPRCVLTESRPECTFDSLGVSAHVTFFDSPTSRAKVEFFGANSDNEPVSILAGGSGTAAVHGGSGSLHVLELKSRESTKQITLTLRRAD